MKQVPKSQKLPLIKNKQKRWVKHIKQIKLIIGKIAKEKNCCPGCGNDGNSDFFCDDCVPL